MMTESQIRQNRVRLREISCIAAQGGMKDMAGLTHQKRLTLSVDQADYDALHNLSSTMSPSVDLQYLMRLAVRNLLDQHAARQLANSIERRP
jgi:hypothetical protein